MISNTSKFISLLLYTGSILIRACRVFNLKIEIYCMKRILRRLFWFLSGLLVLLMVVAVICFKPLDTTPYQKTDFYKKEMEEINKISEATKSTPPILSFREDSLLVSQGEFDSLTVMQAGWASVNLLPPFTTPIAIDDHRGGKHFEGVHDSIYVRAFVFKQGGKKIAYISADLLVVPPIVSKIFDPMMVNDGFDQSNIFFTATHTHTSIGGWHDSYVGVRFAGKFDDRVPRHIADCISKAILEAEKKCSPVKVGYAEFPTHHLVFNRLVKEKGKVDSLLRIVKFEKANGERAAIITFAAHCTVFHQNLMSLSGDWAGLMMTELKGKIDFPCFSAGAVGSHGPYEETKDQEEEARYMADHVAKIVADNFDSIPISNTTLLSMTHLPLYLREPNERITQNIAVRPWLFKKLFGDEKVYINTLQIRDIFFAGTPCDFSGELLGPIDSVANERDLKLIVTSFNGGYIGYITDSKWYGMKTYETWIMGWFGPGNGDYMSEVLERLIGTKPVRPGHPGGDDRPQTTEYKR
jgi:neutral ceramidase